MTTAHKYEKPLPHLTELNKPFWLAARERKLLLQRCNDCGQFIFFPRPLCPHCGSENLKWEQGSGRGKVHTFGVIRRPTVRGFDAEVPYVFAIVELEEGPRMVTNIVGCPVEQVKVNMPVEAVYEDVTPEITMVKFRPATGGVKR